MKKEKISEIINNIDEKYIDEATEFALNSNKEKNERHPAFSIKLEKQPYRLKWTVLAACLALFIVIGFTATAFAVEAAEYKTAVSFFEENGLSADGLSRSEVKAVYRDITTNSFTFGKTAEVLKQVVPGWEIGQDKPTPEELASLWNRNVWIKSVSQSGVDYRVDSQYVFDQQKGFDVLDKCILECYSNGEKLWSAEFTDFYVEGYSYTKDGTAVWGSNLILSSSDTSYGWIALVDHEGNVIWQRRLDHDFKNEYVASILRNTDGTWAVISRGDLQYLCLCCCDAGGNELSFRKTEVGNLGIWNAARLGDGYIVQLGNSTSHVNALLYKMDREGNVTDSFSYEADDCEYYLTDMIEFAGHVYLSAYAVPKQDDEGGRHEIANVLDYVSNKGWNISDEELTPIVRDNYTAVMLVCDSEGGVPKTFYSVKGSLGGKFSVDDAELLEWNVESIVSTFFSPVTNSFTIGGTCKVFAYTFDAEGNLIGQTDTGETTPYRR
ncbi:MAG: hypothetical protein IJS45_10705 [Clostridia bacterium]|nr:hypothetical protein [Clostridia bacterium]